jgi:hypothetical protein
MITARAIEQPSAATCHIGEIMIGQIIWPNVGGNISELAMTRHRLHLTAKYHHKRTASIAESLFGTLGPSMVGDSFRCYGLARSIFDLDQHSESKTGVIIDHQH